MKVEYVDLRFADKIVVKPAKHGEGNADSAGDNTPRQKKGRPKKNGGKGTGGKAKNNVG
jgi:hypothetical protein